MPDKPKAQDAQEVQKTQKKRQKAKAVDIIIQDAKNKANKTGKPEAVVFKNRETGEIKLVSIEMPDDPNTLYLDEIDPNSPTYNPEKLEQFKKRLATFAEGNEKRIKAYFEATEKLTETAQTLSKNITLIQARLFEALRNAAPAVKELAELLPYIEKQAAAPEYAHYGKDLDEIIINLETEGTDQNGNIIPGSVWETLTINARAAKELEQARAEGRKQRKAAKEKAQKANAIMTLQNGQLPIVSAELLWDAFAPGKICEMGTLSPSLIDNTGRIMKANFDDGEIITTEQTAPIQAYLILSAINANSVENVREEFIKNGELSFYVKGVIDQLSSDPRGLLPAEIADDLQMDINRKTAGVLYLENLFKPLQNQIGIMPDGQSRYSVFNYIGYDADNDTMTIKTPYIYQLLKGTQAAYFARKERIKIAQNAGKSPKDEDYKPLELNSLLKGPAITEDTATIEAALYITDVMLAAGSGNNKKTELIFKTIIEHCPTMKQRIAEIEASNKQNKAAFINRELQKIGKAIALILNPEKCTATTFFEILSIEPSKRLNYKKGEKDLRKKMQFISPTRSKLGEKLVIKWNNNHKEEHENS